MAAGVIKIILADDHALFVEGIALLLGTIEHIEVIGIAHNGEEVLRLLKENSCDLALLDVHMPVMDGIETTLRIKKLYPHIQVVALTMEDEDTVIHQMKGAGAVGYVLKTADKATLSKAIYGALPLAKVQKLNSSSDHNLTEREVQILQLIAQEYNTPQIADKLSISVKTVETHRKNMLKKAQVKNVTGLVKFGIQQGIVKLRK